MKIKIRYLILLAYIVFFTIFILTSCNTIQLNNCPYLITEQYVSFDEENDSYNYVGAYFSILNNSNKTIRNLTICFSLFDAEGNLLSLGNGQFKTKFEGEIPAGKKQEIVISLDNALGNTADSEFRIDFVYVSSITYEDESIWQDYIGLYSL